MSEEKSHSTISIDNRYLGRLHSDYNAGKISKQEYDRIVDDYINQVYHDWGIDRPQPSYMESICNYFRGFFRW